VEVSIHVALEIAGQKGDMNRAAHKSLDEGQAFRRQTEKIS
jgi:hypothetical protein